MRLLLRGDADAGLGLYRDALQAGGLPKAPVGMHLLFLNRAGRTTEAAELRSVALREGADLSMRAAGFGTSPAEAASEYRKLISGGTANSRMVWEYLLQLSLLGETDEVAAILSPDALLRKVALAVDAEAVAQLLLREEARGTYQEAVDSVRGMTKIKRLHHLPDPAVAPLVAALKAATLRYFEDWRASGHPLSHLVPDRFYMHVWGLISRGEGYNIRHIHHRGWATGIYYPVGVPEDQPGGELRIGCPARLGETSPGWPDAEIRPEPGLLVLMPSFYTHWTVPLGRPGLRMSVAFDLS
jgi:hypothetical protein